MTDWQKRLSRLEEELCKGDPRPALSAYHDRPYAIYHYMPNNELALRSEVYLMKNRLETKAAKRVTLISMAECLNRVVDYSPYSWQDIAEAEEQMGLEIVVRTIHELLNTDQQLENNC